MLAELVDEVVGVDPDRDRITAAIIDARTQGQLDRIEVGACPAGYAALIEWADEHSSADRRVWSIEGAGSYGAGLTATLEGAGEWVVEFDRPSTRPTRDGAKSDGLDALRAARELLGRTQWAQPRARGVREGLRALLVARSTAERARTMSINALKALIVTSPVQLREELRVLTRGELLERCARFRPRLPVTGELDATKLAMRTLAQRIADLDTEMAMLANALEAGVTQHTPALLDEIGVGPVTAAQAIVSWSHPGRCRHEAAFARLSGTAPIEASSGQQQNRHRLNRGGDRQLNRALHTVVITRIRVDPVTRAYIHRRAQEGKTSREARRCLKRYVARRLYRILEQAHRPLDKT
jgi:transposase